ncbi:MAG: undecaprenyldiphospho-muramoylpentapeptide beta-N-acetylglucosaminyltransferase [Lachnospiraceae bacterium]|nr:undecaprenyldiphospho-muramoylpentapeptide beta-N-acetylglucosaminyltransferase [Lachnospiraceae bacterium]
MLICFLYCVIIGFELFFKGDGPLGLKIVLTGGGTAGHVTPNIALIPHLKERGYDIAYIGTNDGIEKKLLSDFDLRYYGISAGKLRRYFDPKDFSDPFRVIKGYGQARRILKQEKPDVIFSKGGFVSVPVIHAASTLKIPCILHESDLTPGLANKLCIPFAKKICCNFPETLQYLPKDKTVLTGTPIREELRQGDAAAGRSFCGFTDAKPVIMVFGGSLGAGSINEAMRGAMDTLLKDFNIIHICGDEKMDNLKLSVPGYRQFEYVKAELKDLFALADIVVSRAGANSICELLALKKPNILIPLSVKTSRGDQILNARSFEKQGFSVVIEDEDLDEDVLIDHIRSLYRDREQYLTRMKSSGQPDAIHTILDLIDNMASSGKKR